MYRSLPFDANLEAIQKEARKLLHALQRSDVAAIERYRPYDVLDDTSHPRLRRPLWYPYISLRRAREDVTSLRNARVKPDGRAREAIGTVIKRRQQNGRWPLNLLHSERIPLQMETDVGSASRWNTLRALRVLRWYNDSTR